MAFGRMGSGFFGSGAMLNSVSLCVLSMVFFAAAPMMQTMMAMMTLKEMEVKSEALLWLPSLRTPKCANCIFGGVGSSLRSGFAIKKILRMASDGGGRMRLNQAAEPGSVEREEEL